MIEAALWYETQHYHSGSGGYGVRVLLRFPTVARGSRDLGNRDCGKLLEFFWIFDRVG